MDIDGISKSDLLALRLLDFIAGRFEADAGFALPGISADEIKPELAESFGCGPLGPDRMESLAALGLLVRRPLSADRAVYAFSPEAARLLEGSASH